MTPMTGCMMKTGEAFAEFIDWDLTELLRGGQVVPMMFICVCASLRI